MVSNGFHKSRLKRSTYKLGKYTDDSKKGLILEIDLEYPTELHDLHNDYPLAPEKHIREKYNIMIGQVKKLIPTLSNKQNYVLHYRNLQLYLDLGLKLKKGS